MFLPMNNVSQGATPPLMLNSTHMPTRMVSSPKTSTSNSMPTKRVTETNIVDMARGTNAAPVKRTTTSLPLQHVLVTPVQGRTEPERPKMGHTLNNGTVGQRRHFPSPQSPQMQSRLHSAAHIPTPQLQALHNNAMPTNVKNLAAFALPQQQSTAASPSAVLNNGIMGARFTTATPQLQNPPARVAATTNNMCVPRVAPTTRPPAPTMKNLNARAHAPPATSPSGSATVTQLNVPLAGGVLLKANLSPQTAPLATTTPLQANVTCAAVPRTGPLVGLGVNGGIGASGTLGRGHLMGGVINGVKPNMVPRRTVSSPRSTSPFHQTTAPQVLQAFSNPVQQRQSPAMRAKTLSPAASRATCPTQDSEARSTLEGATQVTISNRVLHVGDILGKGSFGSVWAATTEDGCHVAIKEICGDSSASYDKATSEMQIVARIQREIGAGSGMKLRIPKCLYWDTQKLVEREKWRIRMVMERIHGMPLSSWMLKYLGDPSFTLHKATVMALTLLKQLAPTMNAIERFVYHRDVNSHNILVVEGENSFDFVLIDFGLAVDSATWRGSDSSRRMFVRAAPDQSSWKTLDIGGDCKYWPTASWKQFLWGWKSLSDDDVYHYRHRLDFHSLGITCYELIFYQAPSVYNENGITPELRHLIDDLREVWAHYWTQSTHYWSQLFGTFSGKRDWNALRDLMRQSVTNAFQSNLERLRQATNLLLRATFPPQWAHMKPLFSVMYDLIDTRGSLSWRNVDEVVTAGIDCESVRNHLPMKLRRESQRAHRRARSIDTDSYSVQANDLPASPSYRVSAVSAIQDPESPLTHFRAKSDPEREPVE